MKYKPAINFVFLLTTDMKLKLFDDITSSQGDIAKLLQVLFFTSGRDWAGFSLVGGIDEIFVIVASQQILTSCWFGKCCSSIFVFLLIKLF